MTSLKLSLSFVAIAVMTIVPAVLQGQFANRWQEPKGMLVAAAAMEGFPEQLGSWEMVESDVPLTAGVMRELGVAGYVTRYYKHHESGDVVHLLVMVGQPGPLVRHPPDICFGNRANTLLGETRINVVAAAKGEAPNDFRVLAYQPQSQLQDRFRVAYAFSTEGPWDVPKWPRMTYGADPYLYKVQLQAVEPSESRRTGESPLEHFVRDFVPAFARFRETQGVPQN